MQIQAAVDLRFRWPEFIANDLVPRPDTVQRCRSHAQATSARERRKVRRLFRGRRFKTHVSSSLYIRSRRLCLGNEPSVS